MVLVILFGDRLRRLKLIVCQVHNHGHFQFLPGGLSRPMKMSQSFHCLFLLTAGEKYAGQRSGNAVIRRPHGMGMLQHLSCFVLIPLSFEGSSQQETGPGITIPGGERLEQWGGILKARLLHQGAGLAECGVKIVTPRTIRLGSEMSLRCRCVDPLPCRPRRWNAWKAASGEGGNESEFSG